MVVSRVGHAGVENAREQGGEKKAASLQELVLAGLVD